MSPLYRRAAAAVALLLRRESLLRRSMDVEDPAQAIHADDHVGNALEERAIAVPLGVDRDFAPEAAERAPAVLAAWPQS